MRQTNLFGFQAEAEIGMRRNKPVKSGRPRAKPHKLSPIEIKTLVRHRDGYRCVECGMTARQHVRRHGRTLDVHRIDPGSAYTMRGCVTLCQRCHKSKPKAERFTSNRPKVLTVRGPLADVVRKYARSHGPPSRALLKWPSRNSSRPGVSLVGYPCQRRTTKKPTTIRRLHPKTDASRAMADSLRLEPHILQRSLS